MEEGEGREKEKEECYNGNAEEKRDSDGTEKSKDLMQKEKSVERKRGHRDIDKARTERYHC